MPKAWILVAGVALGLAGAWLTVKLLTPAGFSTEDGWVVNIYSPEGESKGDLRMWKFRDGLLTCYVTVSRSRDLWQPSAQCSLFFP